MIIWAAFLGLLACAWASRHLEISRARREQLPLRADSYPGPPENPPLVSVLIAAKDEEDNIEAAVRTMLAQDYPNFEFIVINDRSTDRTREILDAIHAEQPNGRLQVVHVSELREGWFGKNNAMREGVERARGEWLCFSDADCRQVSTRTLSMAVHHAAVSEIDLLSVLPRLETHSLWERIIQPVCGGVMIIWFHPKHVNNPDHPAAYANGAFMLMTRDCYRAVGGHEAVRTEVNEDMHMARRAKKCGQRLAVIQNEELYTVRMYTRLKDIWRGWSRIFYGCFGTFRRLLVTMLMLAMMNLFPYGSLAASAAVLLAKGWGPAGAGWHWVAAASALAVVLQQTVIARYYRLSRTNPWLAPTFIIGATICVGMLANAMTKLGGRRTTVWRGTTYRGAEKVSG